MHPLQGFQIAPNRIKGKGEIPSSGEIGNFDVGNFLSDGGNLMRSDLTIQTFFKAKNNIL